VNRRQREAFFAKIIRHFDERAEGLAGKRLCFWGLAFKPRTDDVREAPALTLIREALAHGVECVGFDSVAAQNARREIGPELRLADDMYAAADDADGLVVCTDWDEFKSPNFQRLRGLMRHPAIFDGRNLYDPADVAERGFFHHSVGRASVEPR